MPAEHLIEQASLLHLPFPALATGAGFLAVPELAPLPVRVETE
jgi:hypothetical protein